MWWMKLKRRRAGERGAMTVLIVICLSGFMLGLGAIVTDTGAWYSERAQLQNGADAASFAVAQQCTSATGCANDPSAANPQSYQSVAKNEANHNANDEATTVDTICGRVLNKTGSNQLPDCTTTDTGTTGSRCPVAPASPTQYVDVHTTTKNPLNTVSSSLTTPLIGAWFGDSGQNIKACAQVQLGAAVSCDNCAALTISACEWLENTGNGTKFATPWTTANPVYPPSFLDALTARKAAGINFTNATNPDKETTPDGDSGVTTPAGVETVLTTHGLGSNPCAAGHPGWDAPGAFGWLLKKTGGSSCQVSIDPVTGTYTGSPGNAPADCNALFNASYTNQTPIYLPVYDTVNSGGSNTTYHLLGLAAFVVTGWDIQQGNVFSPKTQDSKISLNDNVQGSGAHYCGNTYTGSNSDVCLYGYFTQALIPPSVVPGGGGGNNLGATFVKFSG
jgi:Flp pilus assembly protein TadG